VKKLVLVVLGLGLGGSLAGLFLLRGRLHTPSKAEDFAHLQRKSAPPVLWPAPAFDFTSHRGERVTRESLLGRPWVANFVFTTCRTVCPLLTAKMVRLQRDVVGVDARFVSFSVDPEHDTVEVLADYARRWNPDEARWALLATTPEGLAAIARGFRITAERVDGGVDPIMHSAVFVLVDAQGVVRGIYDSEDSADFRGLSTSLRALAAPAAQAPRAERSGEVLYHELSCANCHERPELAPALGGLLGTRRELESRLLITADEAYVRESILAPDAKRVAGYPLKMPSYEGHLTRAELDALVQYVMALPAPAAAPAGAEVAVDPVCHMKVRVTADALHEGDVYFCSAWCRERYRENPDAYRPPAAK
jgi:protein SCO1/2